MIKDKLLKEIEAYCKLNGMGDVEAAINKLLQQGFTVEKYGVSPDGTTREPKVVEKIVEVIREVEVIKEVPVEVIKEVPVEKIVEVSDDSKINELLGRIKKLEFENADNVSKYKSNIQRQTQTIMKLNKNFDVEVDRLNEVVKNKEQEIEELKNRKDSTRDIYGEGGARWGSNLLD